MNPFPDFKCFVQPFPKKIRCLHFSCLLLLCILIGTACKKDTEVPVDDSGTLVEVNCWDGAVRAEQDEQYNRFFTRFGDGWTGGDATYSTLLPDGRIFWSFGDSFWGKVNPDRSRPPTALYRNAVMIQDGTTFGSFETIWKDTLDSARAFIAHPDDPSGEDQWYWPFDATVHQGKLQLLLSGMERIGAGSWGFAYKATDLAIYSLPDLKLESLIRNKYDFDDISYGSCVFEDEDGFIYIFGISNGFLVKRVHVARAPQGDLAAEWEFWDGSTWSSTPSRFSIFESASDQFSIRKAGDKYYLITQEIIFSARILRYESSSGILGPYTNKRVLYCTPETIPDIIFTYNTFDHPELSEQGELVLSYNVNSHKPLSAKYGLFADADVYRPYFIRIYDWQ